MSHSTQPTSPRPAHAAPDTATTWSPLDTRPGVRRGLIHAAVIVAVALAVSVTSATAAIHVVEPGETLTDIAARHDRTVTELAERNDIADPDVLLAGTSLHIPETIVHEVVAGDTLWRLAGRYGSSVAAIVEANDLDGDLLTIGRRLEIPDAVPTGATPADAVAAAQAPPDAAPAASEPVVLSTPTGVIAPILGVGAAGGWSVQTPCGLAAEVADGTPLGPVDVVLDPGHGGWEVAAVGPNGLTEKDLNLTVSLRAAELLRERGYRVGLTRTTDVYVPIAARAAIAHAFEADLFVSVHHNGGAVTPSSRPGTQAYHQHADPESRRAAGILYEELYTTALDFPTAWVGNVHDGVGGRLGATGDDFYGVLRLTQGIPAVITEFLWLSNGPEAELLARDDVQEAEARAIADGVVRWFETTDAGSGYLGVHTDSYDSGGGGLAGCVDPSLE